MKIKALVIAPYEGLREVVKQVASEYSQFDVDVEVGNLEEGAEIVSEMGGDSYHVIISRGGTAEFIRQVVTIPVIDIQVSGYDMLRVLTLVSGYPGKSAIVGFSNISQGASTICSLLDMEIENLTIENREEVRDLLTDLKAKGYEVVIGDVVTVNAAKEIGLTGILITSGVEAVANSFEDAERIHGIFDGMKKELDLYKAVFDHDKRGMLLLEGKRIVQKNSCAESLLNTPKRLESITQFAQKSVELQKESKMMFEHEESVWEVTASPLLIHSCVVVLKKIWSKKDLSKGIEIYELTRTHAIIGTSGQMKSVKEKVMESSKEERFVWIVGEHGTGKELVAEAIHQNSEKRHLPFVKINCKQIGDVEWGELLTNSSFGTVYLKNIEALHSAGQQLLCQVIEKRKNGPRVVVSSNQALLHDVKKGNFEHELYYSLADQTIFLPPLYERKEDIEALVHLFISQLQSKIGKQIVGIRKDALMALQEYDWPGNVDQLKQTLKQLISESKSYYIEKEATEFLLHKLQTHNDAKNNSIYNGTLAEIEKQVIMQVLKEENMNQSRAAERLGINRSTLWRKLK